MKDKFRLNPELKVIKPNWQGNPIVNGDEYTNGEGLDSRFSLLDILKWKLFGKDFKNGKKDKDYQLNIIKNSNFVNSKEDMIVWLGHASFFIRIAGITIITDPIFYSMPFVKRKAEMPCKAEELKNIDYVLLSHGHRDHFDAKSMKILKLNNPNMEVLLPMDLGKWFSKNGIEYQEAAWFQEYKTKDEVSITFMPALHWNRRDGNDFNKNLWGSFVIKANGKSIFFAGDTAYGEHFKEIGKYFPNIDFCLMPIAAYRPDYIMKQSHLSPWEAVDAFKDLGGEIMFPMHYGTFQLADEYFGEPEEVMQEKSKKENIHILAIGEEFSINSSTLKSNSQ